MRSTRWACEVANERARSRQNTGAKSRYRLHTSERNIETNQPLCSQEDTAGLSPNHARLSCQVLEPKREHARKLDSILVSLLPGLAQHLRSCLCPS